MKPIFIRFFNLYKSEKMRKILLFTFICLLSTVSSAQNGENDPTFNPFDFGFGNGDGVFGIVNDVDVQEDGKILVAGNFSKYNSESYSNLIRLEADGSIDASFNLVGSFDGPVKLYLFKRMGKL